MGLPLRTDTMIAEALEAYRDDRLVLYQKLCQIDDDVYVEFICSLDENQSCSAYISLNEVGRLWHLPEKYKVKIHFPNPNFGVYSRGDLLHAAAQRDLLKRSD